jgi:hypothetical protein
MQLAGSNRPTGILNLTVTRGNGRVEHLGENRPTPWPTTLRLADILTHGFVQSGLPAEVNTWRRANRKHLSRRLKKVLLARTLKLPSFYGALYLEVKRGNGERVNYGLASVGVVTTAGVGFITDAFQNLVELEAMNFHGFGTGGAAEAVGNTALTTELTTQYVTDNVRPTGTQSEPSANVYRTSGILDPDVDVTITEHGIFSQAATGGGVLLDRSLFAGVPLVGANGDTLTAVYDFTSVSGS